MAYEVGWHIPVSQRITQPLVTIQEAAIHGTAGACRWDNKYVSVRYPYMAAACKNHPPSRYGAGFSTRDVALPAAWRGLWK
jgi:hypothetical protein